MGKGNLVAVVLTHGVDLMENYVLLKWRCLIIVIDNVNFEKFLFMIIFVFFETDTKLLKNGPLV